MKVSRRGMLSGSATLLTGGVVGALTVSSIASEQAAAADAELDVTGDAIEIRGQEVAAVWLDMATEWAYAVPSGGQPARVELDVLAGTNDDLEVVATADSDEVFLESSGDEVFEVDLVDAGVVDGDDLVPDEGGESTTTVIEVGVEMRLYDEDGLVIAADSERDDAELVVEKSEYDPDEHGEVAGGGSVTIEVE